MKILFVRLSAMGDIVHAMPAAMALKKALPDARLDWVVQTNFADLLINHPAVDNIISFRRRSPISEWWRLRTKTRKAKYDIALDMQGLLKSAIVVFLSGAPVKLGYYHQREYTWLFSKPIRPPQNALHVIEHYLVVAEAVTNRKADVVFGLRPQPNAITSVKEKISEILNEKLLAINLGAGKTFKCWPIPHFAKLVNLAEKNGWRCVIVGSSHEQVLYEELCKELRYRPFSLVGKTSVGELVALLSLVDAHVGVDTGSIHIAVALGTPVVCIMGPTDPRRSGPYPLQNSRSAILYKGPEGISQITPEEVITKVEEIVEIPDERTGIRK